jgi:hypothetical protein
VKVIKMAISMLFELLKLALVIRTPGIFLASDHSTVDIRENIIQTYCDVLPESQNVGAD